MTSSSSRSPGWFRRRVKTLSSGAVVGLSLVVAGVGYTVVAAPSSAVEPASVEQSTLIEEGRALYVTGCSTCHGLDLTGTGGGPSLIGVGGASVTFQVASGRMPLAAATQQAPRKPTQYTDLEIDALAEYIQFVGGGVPMPELDYADGDLQLGGDLFRTNCASCHNFAGSGGALSYGKFAPELGPASPEVIYAAMLSGPENMPRYSDAQLSPDEKQAITRFIRYTAESQDPGGIANLGRYGPVSEGLVATVVGLLVLVGITLWIGSRA